MAKKIEGYESNRGAAYRTQREAVVDDVCFAMHSGSQEECVLSALEAGFMVENARQFIQILEQVVPERDHVVMVKQRVDYLEAQLRLISSMDTLTLAPLPPADVLKRIQVVASDALREG